MGSGRRGLAAEQASHRPGISPALGLRAEPDRRATTSQERPSSCSRFRTGTTTLEVRSIAAAAPAPPRYRFTRTQIAGAVTRLDLNGGSSFGTYLIQNGSATQFLAHNHRDLLNEKPLAFFSFRAANPDRVQHVRQTSQSV